MSSLNEEVKKVRKRKEPKKPPRIDYVIVVPKDIKRSALKQEVEKFLSYLQSRGIRIKPAFGNIKDNIYLMLHMTDESVNNFAEIYDIHLDDVGHNLIATSSITFKICQTPLSGDLFEREGAATNSERIIIMNSMLCEARFGESDTDHKYGVQKLINLGAVKDVYPLHDGSFESDGDPTNDRQLLLKYWANFALWYKEQPLNLIEKYYGTEVAFYFAWLGFYNKMLIPASVVGVVCFLFSLIRLNFFPFDRLEDTCSSDLLICPWCLMGHSCIPHPLKLECSTAGVNTLFDNYGTVFFAVFMSFWATIFMNLWHRAENVLKLRWNVTTSTIIAKTKTRESNPQTRLSDHGGNRAIHPAWNPNSLLHPLVWNLSSFGWCCPDRGPWSDHVQDHNFGTVRHDWLQSSRQIHAADFAVHQRHDTGDVHKNFYAPLSEWLTKMENPRTQFEFDNSVVHKRYILGFANNYAALFYIAFFKGRFYIPTYTSVTSLKTDICPPSGCMMALSIQLFVLMLLKSMAGNILTLIVPIITKSFAKKTETRQAAQYEAEFLLYPAGRYLLTTEFMEMSNEILVFGNDLVVVIQYGFVTFFVAAFPLAPLCALINNCMELRLDAYKLVTRYRRPVPKKQSGIGPWKDILEVITNLSIATNAFVLAFTSDFVPREIYRYRHGASLEGYVKSTLSIFDLKDRKSYTGNSSLCYYRALRYPPDHPKKYELTAEFWYELGMRLVFVIIFEHIVMLSNGLLAYFIPDLPKNISQQIYNEDHKQMFEKLEAMDKEGKKAKKLKKEPNLKVTKPVQQANL